MVLDCFTGHCCGATMVLVVCRVVLVVHRVLGWWCWTVSQGAGVVLGMHNVLLVWCWSGAGMVLGEHRAPCHLREPKGD